MNTKNFLIFQSIILSAGTTFAWYTVFTDFAKFYAVYDTVFRVKDCAVPNPITTPCFYGAFAFLAALMWSLAILKREKEQLVKNEKGLLYLLVGGTIFAWGNFSYMLYGYYTAQPSAFSCVVGTNESPFTSACFIGSCFFLTSLVLAAVTLKRLKREQ